MCNQTVSRWEKASTVATFLELLVVGVSLLFIGYQLQQQKLQLDQQVKLSRAANTQALVDLVTPLNLKVTEREMAELWVKGEDGIEKDPVKDRAVEMEQYQTMLASYMVFYENVYTQCLAGLLDEEIYNGWDKDLAVFIKEHKITKHWNEWKDLYREDFGAHVDQLIASPRSTLPKQRCPK